MHDLSGLNQDPFASFTQMISSSNLRERLEAVAPQARAQGGQRLSDLDIPPDRAQAHLLAPITRQEVWAAGVTYLRSREARMQESADGGSFYDLVYNADRPELFFKATPNRVAGPNGKVRIRSDSRWNVPEPELALIVNPVGELVAFTVGNDMSSRDIEGQNPLYLPQAKVYQGSCALGPALLLAHSVPDAKCLSLRIAIRRGGDICFEGATSIAQMKRTFEDLIHYLYRDQEFPSGAILLTGTGIVPPDDFSLNPGDLVEITVPEIGTLRNVVE